MTEKILLTWVIALQVLYFLYLIIAFRVPGGHDGFEYFILQYYFLNNVVHSGEIPQWIPFLTHGTIANWWYPIQAGLAQCWFLLTGGLLKAFNFFYIFYAGVFSEELFLLVGTWVLAGKFYKSVWAVFFVSLCVLTSCLWMTQPWFNFHFIYSLPFILYFLHLFFETGMARYWLLAGNLSALQLLGNPTYVFPLISLVIFLYFSFFLFENPKVFILFLRKIDAKRFLMTNIFLLVFLGVVYMLLTLGADQIASYVPGRNSDMTSPLAGFIYGGFYDIRSGLLNLSKWKELLFGISPSIDYTLYSGVLVVPLFFLGLFAARLTRIRHLFFLILVLLLFSTGSFAAVLFYHVWPGMKFYRNVALISPIIKIFVCFAAGHGLDLLLQDHLQKHVEQVRRRAVAIVCVFLAGVIYLLAVMPYSVLNEHVRSMSIYGVNVFSPILEMQRILKSASLGAVYLICFWLLVINKPLVRVWVIVGMLCFHAWDVSEYKLSESKTRSMVLGKGELASLQFQPMPFHLRREENAIADNSSRAGILSKIKNPDDFYWSTDAFLFKDSVGHRFRTDYWLKPFDALVRAYDHTPNDAKPKGLMDYLRFDFPLNTLGARKVTGVSEDRVQFFVKPAVLTQEDTVSLMADPSYAADTLLLMPAPGVPSQEDPRSLMQSNQRRFFGYHIDQFDSNNLKLSVDVRDQDKVWLFLSDTWHPYWHAMVNGHKVAVSRANLAYKAIPLDEGMNHVHFYFRAPGFVLMFFIFGVNMFLWTLGMFYFIFNLYAGRKTV